MFDDCFRSKAEGRGSLCGAEILGPNRDFSLLVLSRRTSGLGAALASTGISSGPGATARIGGERLRQECASGVMRAPFLSQAVVDPLDFLSRRHAVALRSGDLCGLGGELRSQFRLRRSAVVYQLLDFGLGLCKPLRALSFRTQSPLSLKVQLGFHRLRRLTRAINLKKHALVLLRMTFLGLAQVLILRGQHMVVSTACGLVSLHRLRQLRVELHDLSVKVAAHPLRLPRLVPQLLSQCLGRLLGRRQGGIEAGACLGKRRLSLSERHQALLQSFFTGLEIVPNARLCALLLGLRFAARSGSRWPFLSFGALPRSKTSLELLKRHKLARPPNKPR